MNGRPLKTKAVTNSSLASFQEKFTEAIELVLSENYRVLEFAVQPSIAQLAQKIIDSDYIFVCGEGRSGLVVRMVAMRLMHLGCQVYVVGETTTPSIKSGNLLIACSGSGSTESVCAIASKAKAIGVHLVAVTASRCSPLEQLVDFTIELPASAKQDFDISRSQQFAGSLFEQSTLLLFDALFHVLSQLLHKNAQTLWAHHTNLE